MPETKEKGAIRSEKRQQRRTRRLRNGGEPAPRLVRKAREVGRAAILRVGKETRPVFDGILKHYSEIGDPGYPDPAYFPWVKDLESKAEAIQKELEVLLQSPDRLPQLRKISPDHDRIADSDKWRAFFLFGYGYRAEHGCAQCPETVRALEAVPGLESAFFSILQPGMHIRRHRGPTKSLLVCHLGLKVPGDREKCVIRVDDDIRPWEEGKVLILDDTHEHEVWNDTDETRVVLLFHVRRPLRFPGSLVGDFIFNAIRSSPFVRDGRRNLADWEEQFRLRDAAQSSPPPS
ncbi:MAG: aspartyl/asparaginyl beta-hydroxylase domain-containing protein [Myxococcota bacterium]